MALKGTFLTGGPSTPFPRALYKRRRRPRWWRAKGKGARLPQHKARLGPASGNLERGTVFTALLNRTIVVDNLLFKMAVKQLPALDCRWRAQAEASAWGLAEARAQAPAAYPLHHSPCSLAPAAWHLEHSPCSRAPAAWPLHHSTSSIEGSPRVSFYTRWL